MRYSKHNALLRAYTSNIHDSATPSSITYAYNGGSLLGILMVTMIATGLLLSFHYVASATTSFTSVMHIMNDISYGSVIRYIHANTASLVFVALYIHVTRGLYYSSYRMPRTGTWLVGVVILVLAIAVAFLGYSLVYGQMSLWGATVICSLFTSIPIYGSSISILLWGGYAVSSNTLSRFYALHYLLALVVIAMAAVHLIILHMHGSSTPIGINAVYDKASMWPSFIVKDSITILLAIVALCALVAYVPNVLSHSDNYIAANAMSTPSSIVPEWYLLTYYAILRSVPSKLLGVVMMLAAIVWLAAMIVDVSMIRSSTHKVVTRVLLVIGLLAWLTLLSLGSQHIEAPYIMLGQVMSVVYFIVLLGLLPSIGIVENELMSRHSDKQ